MSKGIATTSVSISLKMFSSSSNSLCDLVYSFSKYKALLLLALSV